MKLHIIISVFITYQISLVTGLCDGVYINSIYHDKKVLTTGLDRPFALTTDFTTDTVYFTYAKDGWKSALYDLKHDVLKPIEAVAEGFSYAVDHENEFVYLGTPNGIYTYDEVNDEAVYVSGNNTFIWDMFFKDQLYYSLYPSQEIFAYNVSTGETVRYTGVESEDVHFFLIDIDNDIFYSNNTGLYYQKDGANNSVIVEDFDSPWDLRALTADIHGNVHACFEDGIYTVKMVDGPVILNKIYESSDCFGLTFDSEDSVIYSDGRAMYKYTPREDDCKIISSS